jgi:hypothetical protein
VKQLHIDILFVGLGSWEWSLLLGNARVIFTWVLTRFAGNGGSNKGKKEEVTRDNFAENETIRFTLGPD